MTTTPTFSQSLTAVMVGVTIDGLLGATNSTVPDNSVDGIALAHNGYACALRQGSEVLAKGPDGALHWYKLGGSATYPILHYKGP